MGGISRANVTQPLNPRQAKLNSTQSFRKVENMNEIGESCHIVLADSTPSTNMLQHQQNQHRMIYSTIVSPSVN